MESAQAEHDRLTSRSTEGDQRIINPGPGARITQQPVEFALICFMHELLEPRTFEIFGITACKGIRRTDREGHLACAVQFEQEISIAECERNKPITLRAQEANVLALVIRQLQISRGLTQSLVSGSFQRFPQRMCGARVD
ncbi:MAG: hypothetical protein HOF34_14125 [Rhodospirillaceae bacterium]|nr:hypothetical protein [Rhodospirillaceae bacterium]